MPTSSHPQLIRRLTPLQDAMAHLGPLLKPVTTDALPVEAAYGLVLGEDAVCDTYLPPHPVAALDGYAVAAADLVGASPYAPAYLSIPPGRVNIGAALPPGTDTVVSEDDVSENAGMVEISEPAAPGDHVRQRGDEAVSGETIGAAGQAVTAPMIGALHAAGTREIRVRRPRILLRLREDIQDRRAAMLAQLIADAGGMGVAQEPADLEIRVGGTGTGSADHAVADLCDRIVCHGIAIAPGASAAIAQGTPPVLLLPGALDAMLGAWLTIARPAIDRLTARTPSPRRTLTLMEKVTSSIGVSDVFLVRETAVGLIPIPLAGARLADIAAARFWFAVDAASEGFPAGQSVQADTFAHK